MAESKGFDLSALIDSVPDLDTGRQQIVYLPIEQIDPDPENFYSLDGIDELAGSIEMLGLQQPLLVRPGEDGKYIVISGHRRRAAILLIRDGGSRQFAEGVPCIIDTGTASEALREFKLIMGNMDTRKMSSADENKQAERVEILLVKLEDEGFQFSGRRRDWVAKITGMSRSKLGRLKVIRDKLAPEIKEKYYDKGKLNENVAYTLAQMEPELQVKLFKASTNATAAGYERIAKIVQAGNDYSCTGLSGPGCSKCTHGTAFLRHDLEDPCDPCKGETCCLKCSKSSRDYWPCERMCSKAKDRRTKKNAAEKEKEKKQQEDRSAKMRLELQASAQRLVKAIDAAGLDDDTVIPGKYDWRGKKVSWIRKAANGEDVGYVYSNDLVWSEFDVVKAAQVLHCSADYICGLTEELTSTGGSLMDSVEWQHGEPPKAGLYWVCVPWSAKGTSMKWDPEDKSFHFPATNGKLTVDEIPAWWPLPEV